MTNTNSFTTSSRSTVTVQTLPGHITHVKNTFGALKDKVRSFEERFGKGKRLDFEQKFQSVYPAILTIAKMIERYSDNPDVVFSHFLDRLDDRLQKDPISVEDLNNPIYTAGEYQHGFQYLFKELDLDDAAAQEEFVQAANHLTTATENFRAFVFTYGTEKDHEFNYSTWFTRIGMPGGSEKSSWIFKHGLSLLEGEIDGLSENNQLEADHRHKLSDFFRDNVFRDYALKDRQSGEDLSLEVDVIEALSAQLTDQLNDLIETFRTQVEHDDPIDDQIKADFIGLMEKFQIDYSFILDQEEIDQEIQQVEKRSLSLSRGCEAEFVVEGVDSFDEVIAFLRENGYPTIRTKQEAKKALDSQDVKGTGIYGDHGILFIDQSVNPDRELLEQIKDAIHDNQLAPIDNEFEGELSNAAIWAHYLTFDGKAGMKSIGTNKTYLSMEYASSPGSDAGDDEQAYRLMETLNSHPEWTVTQNNSMGNHNTVQLPTKVEKVNGQQIHICENGQVKPDVLKRLTKRLTWLSPTIGRLTSPEHRHYNLFAAFSKDQGMTPDKLLKITRLDMADSQESILDVYGKDKYRLMAVKGDSGRLMEMRHAQSGNPEVLDKLNRLELFVMQSAVEGAFVHNHTDLMLDICNALIKGGEYRKDELSKYQKIENRDNSPETMQQFRQEVSDLTGPYDDHMRPSPADKSHPTILLEKGANITIADLISRRIVEQTTWDLVEKDGYFNEKDQDSIVFYNATDSDGSAEHLCYYDSLCLPPTRLQRGISPFYRHSSPPVIYSLRPE